MVENLQDPHRLQQLYWNQMYELKVAAAYMRLYRDHLGSRVAWLGALKAIASCTSIAAWAVWRQYAFLWGMVIAASQVADALKDVFPFAKKHKAACELALILAGAFIDAQLEWEGIHSGQYSNDEIMKRLHRIRKMQLEAENHSFPDGLATDQSLLELAAKEAARYLSSTYDVEFSQEILNG